MSRPSQSPQPASQVLALQYLRALSVLAVVAAHQLQEQLPAIKDQASVALDIFFVGSGFIITALMDWKPVSPGRFRNDRLTRIVPLYWVATLLSVSIVVSGHQIWGASTDPLHVAKSLLFIPAFNPKGELWPTMPYGWTLNYEMFFYVLFALLLLVPQRWRVAALGGLIGTQVLAGVLLRPHTPLAMTYLDPQMLDFVAGALLARLYGMSLVRRTVPVIIAGTLVIAGVMMMFSRWLPGIDDSGLAVLILSGALLAERLGAMPDSAPFRLLGDASYAIYLFQLFADKVVEVFLRQLERRADLSFDGTLVHPLLSISAAIGLGLVIHRTIERPMTRIARDLFGNSSSRVARSGA